MSDDLDTLSPEDFQIADDPQPGIEQQDQSLDAPQNLASDTMFTERDAQPISVTLEKIDGAILAHLKNMIKPQITVEGRRILVPIEHANSERWKQVRKDGVLRDPAGRVQAPLIIWRRSAVAKNNMTSPVNKYLSRSYVTGWNRHTTYDKFAVLNGITPSREHLSVRIPDYVTLTYNFMIWTDYVEQMNDLIEQLNFEMDNYWGDRGDFKFKVSVESYEIETDVGAESDRVVKSTFVSQVQAYLLPETYIHTDKGTLTTGQKEYTYKKVVTFTEIENTDGAKPTPESTSKTILPDIP